MVLPNDEQVIIELIINAKQANSELQALLKAVNSTNISIQKLQTTIKQLATTSGTSFAQVGGALKQLYAAQVNVSGASVEVGNNLKKAFSGQVDQAIKNLNNQMKDGEGSAHRYARSIDAVRIAMGAIVAMGVFRTIQFIEESMRKAIETAQDFETSLYRLTNVERILSQAGTEITFDELNKSIANIKKQLPIFSETDITKQLSLIGIMTKDLGLTADEMEQLALAIGALNIRSADTEDLMTTTNKVLQSIVSKGPGVGQLGVKFSEAAVTAKAVELGYIKAGESLSDLEDSQRDFVVGQAKVAIAIQNVSGEVQSLGDYMDLNTAKIQRGSAAWEDFLKKVGQIILPLKVAFSQTFSAIFSSIVDQLDRHVIPAFVNLFAVVATFSTVLANVLQGNLASLGEIGAVFDDLKEKFSSIFIPEKAFEGLDTATDSAKALGNALKDISELKDFDDLIEDLSKLQEKLKETQEEFDISQTRAVEDYQIEIRRIVQDYAIKRQRIIEDTNQKLADANRKHREEEKNEEAKFQEQMRQLREKFLFNLEDALRERDARQVLRLQRQYQMDKTALQNEYALRQQQQDQQHATDIARIKRERDERLAELAQEEKIRLQREQEDFALKQQRAQEDHQREMEQIKAQIDERLQQYAEALGEEYNLNERGVNQIYNLLKRFYGPGGKFDQLYAYSASSLVANAQMILDTINQLQALDLLRTSTTPTIHQGAGTGNIGSHTPIHVGGQAEGGTYLATQPTTATFGEAGPEIAQFIPLNKLSQSSGAVGELGSGGVSGMLKLMIDLSPDLEARIVDKSLENVSTVIRSVERQR